MFDIRRYETLGQLTIDWLAAHYHFSFSRYYDANRMGLGTLRVINDDCVKAGGGFDFHPHQDMEIITYVRSGAITHEDSLGNRGVTQAGDVQVMSAGTGIIHAERNETTMDTTLYQIWITPRSKGTKPFWQTKRFPHQSAGTMELLVSGFAEHQQTEALTINQDAAIYGATLAQDKRVNQPLHGAGYLLVSKGSIQLANNTIHAGDGVAILDETALNFITLEPSEIVLIDLPYNDTRLHH